MKIFYYCDGRSYSSIIAGYIHLQKLPSNSIPPIPEILAVYEFNQKNIKDPGVPFFLGKDHHNHEIFITGFGPTKFHDLALQTLHFLLEKEGNLLGWCFFNAFTKIGFINKLGFFLTQNFKMIKLGRLLAASQIQKDYYSLVSLVDSVKELTSIE